jgi:hypothetical protein
MGNTPKSSARTEMILNVSATIILAGTGRTL